VKKRGCVETSEDLVRVFADLFDEVAPVTPEEIDAELRDVGLDPDKVGARMQAAVEHALTESHLNWRKRARRELEDKRTQIAESVSTWVRDRAGIIAEIERLSSQFSGQLGYAYRNLESETDEDLASLLADLEYLASQQSKRGEKK
jgi:hypothetical protein